MKSSLLLFSSAFVVKTFPYVVKSIASFGSILTYPFGKSKSQFKI